MGRALVYFHVAAFLSGRIDEAPPFPFSWSLGGLAATIGGILVLAGIGVTSVTSRIMHVVGLSAGIFVGLSWARMFLGESFIALLGLFPAAVGVTLLVHEHGVGPQYYDQRRIREKSHGQSLRFARCYHSVGLCQPAPGLIATL